MNTPSPAPSPKGGQLTSAPGQAAVVDIDWRSLYRAGGVAALAIIALMPVQLVVFVVWPPPSTVEGFFARFQENWLLGLLSMDLLYMLTNALLIPLYLALCAALRRVSPSALVIALAVALVGLAAYFAGNPLFEMLKLANQHAVAATDAQRERLLAAGQAILAIYQGTAFDVYYIFNGVALLIFAVVMLRSSVFSRATAYSGLLASLLMMVPSSAGAVGMVFALASLAPWAVFSVLVARRLLRMGGDDGGDADASDPPNHPPKATRV